MDGIIYKIMDKRIKPSYRVCTLRSSFARDTNNQNKACLKRTLDIW